MRSQSHCPRSWSSRRIGSPVGPDPRPKARRLDLHERDEAVDLGLPWRELREDAPEPERFLAQPRSHPVVAGGRGVALVEDEVDDLEDR